MSLRSSMPARFENAGNRVGNGQDTRSRGGGQGVNLLDMPPRVILFDASASRIFSSHNVSSERATSRFSGSTASYCRRARSAS